MHAYCTLFDSNYLDKGLVLYKSLLRVESDYRLYILPMDDLCKEILMHMSLRNVVIISQREFESEELRKIKTERSRAEYCWTCTASLIEYVLENFSEEYCTYIDSDMYFFESPQLLLAELYENDGAVQVVEHRFGKGKKAKRKETMAGKYCVQFNTFKNDERGRRILKVWKDQCIAHCSMEPGEMGDQKYLDNWGTQYDCVQELQNHGGGLAPWNIGRYRYLGDEEGTIKFKEKGSNRRYSLVFYHFHHLEYIDEKTVNLNIYKQHFHVDRELVEKIYYPYLKEIEEVKNDLSEQYGFRPLIKKHSGIVTDRKESWLKKIYKKSFVEILDIVENKIVHVYGAKKDILQLGEI